MPRSILAQLLLLSSLLPPSPQSRDGPYYRGKEPNTGRGFHTLEQKVKTHRSEVDGNTPFSNPEAASFRDGGDQGTQQEEMLLPKRIIPCKQELITDPMRFLSLF